ncbi:MAG: YceI family protein [Bacteroidota bacterium]|nr:YceI family protein [Bacteroidota bacterium]
MKKTFIILATVATMLVACKNDPKNKEAKTGDATEIKNDSAGQKYTIVASESSLNWQAYQTLANGGHKGTINIAGGELSVNSGNIRGGNFTMDMTSITPTEMPEPEKQAKLQKHLKSPDFFDVEKYKDAEFTIAEVVKGNGDSATIKGNLKIKDMTNMIEFPAIIKMEDGKITATASFSIDRKKWKLNYMSEKSFGDKIIKDMIDIDFNIVVKK